MQIKAFDFIRRKGFNLTVRGRQVLNKNKVNCPYLSGDSFAQACDVVVYGNKKVTSLDLQMADSIFCPSEKLEELINDYGDSISARLLVLGNADRDFYDLDFDLPPSLKAVYLQNSHISNGFFKTLPIGLENLRHGRNGQQSLFRRVFTEREKTNRILVGPFSPTHQERSELISWGTIRDPRLTVISNRLTPSKLANVASSFKFIACPRGNGTDTHRFWESLYRGSIPVVKESLWSKSIGDLGIPCIQLESWDFEEFEEKSKGFSSVAFNPETMPILWMDYWEKLFKSNLD
jgi:hypothetical protein